MNQVAKARNQQLSYDIFPERTDITHDEVVALVESHDYETVISKTEDELADELEENPYDGFAEIVDKINIKLDEERGE